ALLEFGHELTRDPVAAVRAVKRQPGYPAGDLVRDRVHIGSARSTIAAASTPPGSVPYTRPLAPSRRAAQNASATNCGQWSKSDEAGSTIARSPTSLPPSNWLS